MVLATSREEREEKVSLSVMIQEIAIEDSIWDKNYFIRILSKREAS